jgi:hypothetical protein
MMISIYLYALIAIGATVSGQEHGRSVYGAGGPESYFHGVEKSFGETHYDNANFDANPDPTDPIAFAKGEADATSSDVIYPMDGAGSGEPATIEKTTTESILPEGELNSKNPVSPTEVSQRRGSQLTSIGAGSGIPDDVVTESRTGRLFKRRRRLLFAPIEDDNTGSGYAVGSQPLGNSHSNKDNDAVIPALVDKTIGLDQVKPIAINGPTTHSVYPKWMSKVGSDPVMPPKVAEIKAGLRGGYLHSQIESNNIGTGRGQEFDKFGFIKP